MLTFSTPKLSPAFAHALSFVFSAIYVGSIYISSTTRLSFTNPHQSTHHANGRISPREKLKDERWRDDPDVIKPRLVAVSIASLICCTSVHFVLRSLSTTASSSDTLTRLGFDLTLPPLLSSGWWSWSTFWELARPHLITPVLFFGPLYATWLSRTLPGQTFWSWEEHVNQNLWTWQGIRNVLVVRLITLP